jgi:hypothetical protein
MLSISNMVKPIAMKLYPVHRKNWEAARRSLSPMYRFMLSLLRCAAWAWG